MPTDVRDGDGVVTTRGYFSFALSEQLFPNALPLIFSEHPQIIKPLVTRQDHPDYTSVHDSDPCGGPVLFVDD